MKELTKKILEAGLVNKHTAQLMEKWGNLDSGASDLVGKQKVTADTLGEFAADIEKLLGSQEPIKETVLDRKIEGNKVLIHVPRQSPTVAIQDAVGCVFVLPNNPVQEGDEVFIQKGDKINDPSSIPIFQIVTEVMHLYIGEEVVAKRLTLSS